MAATESDRSRPSLTPAPPSPRKSCASKRDGFPHEGFGALDHTIFLSQSPVDVSGREIAIDLTYSQMATGVARAGLREFAEPRLALEEGSTNK